ncbi:DUF5132 domain-containing protein [Nostoc calcicola FACHB-389]|nr:DUF5132 domain-containing protein [Nostoc calcicola FACHB-3891]OKH35922.1 DUF5132 domain-containing protein [Nostoc calcicola FACHB-389]
MTYISDWPEVNVPEIVESLTAIIIAPVIIPIAAAIKQPVVQTAIKQGITLSEMCKEAVAEVAEVCENIAAEVNAELIHEKQEQFSSRSFETYFNNSKSEVATDLINLVSDLNVDVGQMSKGVVDLRLLVPTGLAALAIHQLINKGLELEEIPWHTLAWYAFEVFTKLNNTSDSQVSQNFDL